MTRDAPSDDTDRRHPDPRGTAAEMAARIGEVMASFPPFPANDASVDDRRAHRRKVDALNAELTALRLRMATDFGAARGWKLTSRGFDVTALSGKRNTTRGKVIKTEWPHVYADHPYRYAVGRQPVGLVSHPYDVSAEKPGDVIAWAEANGLKASFPDFPSWHFPGRTSLVLFEAVGGPGAQIEPLPPAPPPGTRRTMNPLRRLLVLGVNEALSRGVIALDKATPTTGGHFMAEIAGRPSVVLWSDAGFEEVRVSVWWGYDHSRHPQAEILGPSREMFRHPDPMARRSAYPKFVGACVSGWLERKTGAWLQGRGREHLFNIYLRPDLRPWLDAIPDPVSQGFNPEGKFFM